MAPIVTSPSGVGTVDLPEELLEHYKAQGWTEVGEPATKEKPFSQLSKTELTALAATEEIDISDASTNDEIRAAIKAARDSK